ncbi:CHRD domain-containing protein [Mariniflexile sp. AS56]|uniref:CHRD domain-containing protein n=1 Tax=Mariniflexile sp. AS56 TaxID=3063957 RepID=UPI0026EDF062|nr:CHRD domain-containing protein [Mariniflexile sp. AS56]MDO7170605.1 CHRD domain-containing protein [Mariniflexile sp. AS56]
MKKIVLNILLVLPVLFLTNCDDDKDTVVAATQTFQLKSVANPNISGTAKFIENEDNSTTVELQLTGTSSGGSHPAHIHFNTAAESGDIAVTLGVVNGDTGFSTKTFSKLDNGTSVSFSEMLDFDGYVNVHLSGSELTTLVAQGDIGQNELTGKSTVYTLNEKDVAGINGTATFFERKNGEALAVLNIANTPDNGMHPAHIHTGSVATAPGSILFTFNSVNGNTGTSMTNVSKLDNNTSFNYSDVLSINGYVNVHLSAADLGTIVAQGNVGVN